ncbi:MAG TPA: MetQ/NlpA family ABC transporter substrate-binding protein [Herpetosiphonaceae bacterium]
MKLLRFSLLAMILAALAACGGTASPAAETGTTPAAGAPAALKLKVGASPVPHAEILNYIKDNLAAREGLTLEVVEFTDYVQPNLALSEGQIDANFFQHVPYLEQFASDRKLDLASVGAVHIEPLGIYSKKITALDAVPDGAVVAIPNDPTNAGRALQLLAANGLITLKEGVGVDATVQDIATNPKNLEISELEAAQLPRSLEDTTLSVINGNYALEIGLKPNKDALALEKAEGNPYANVLAVAKGHEQDPAVQKLIKLLQSPEVKQFIETKYEGVVIPAF